MVLPAGICSRGSTPPAGAANGESVDALRLPNLSMDGTHTGEPVMAAAQGPGAFRVRGYLANTDLFGIMMRAYGWRENRSVPAK